MKTGAAHVVIVCPRVSRNDVILGIFAAALVVFSLVVALVLPKRNPGFPGRNLRFFLVLCVLLIAGMLGAVEVLGESHDFGAAHGETGGVTEGSPTAPGETTGPPTTTGETETGAGPQSEGDPQAGQEVFTSVANPACGSCHTLEAAGANQTLGPNLDDVLAGQDAASIRESIVEPDAEITEGYADNLMPEDYGETLDEQQLGDLVAFLAESS
jgi:mono/diheme cytochrome c family protein